MRISTTAFLIATILAAGACGSDENAREMDIALRAIVLGKERPSFVSTDREGARLWKQTRQFYETRTLAPAWIADARPRPQMEDLIDALHAAGRHGLDPELYSITLLDQRWREASKGFLTQKGFDPSEAGAMDAWLTYLYMKYASDLANGLSDLASADPSWNIKPEKFDPLAHLEQALEQNRIAESLAELTPQTPSYIALMQALAEHRAIRDKGEWAKVPAALRLKPGRKSPAVPLVARRLAASGDYSGPLPPENTAAPYSSELQDAVKRFQGRHGLVEDGIAGPQVAAELNVPVDVRVRQIELNLERWRWLPRTLGDRYILVNIPEMRLEVWENGRVPLSMPVVVGKKGTETPIFNDEMSYIVFSPYWNIPESIALGETLPAMIGDPEFLSRNNMEVIDESGEPVDPLTMDLTDLARYRFRQKPGAGNSLGLIKFMFPNQYNVYLHDTPSDSLFGRASRAFSHGCVRLADPVALAKYVLRDQPEWTEARIERAMHAGEEKIVRLEKRIPVYLGYWTARVDDQGRLQFRKDVYGIDRAQRSRVVNRVNRMRRAAQALSADSIP